MNHCMLIDRLRSNVLLGISFFIRFRLLISSFEYLVVKESSKDFVSTFPRPFRSEHFVE